MTTSSEATVNLRDLESIAEMRAVEDLQIEIWGISDRDIVPLTHLVAAKEAGGIIIGAFDSAKMVGFVYGFVGYEQDEITMHSHMLAVKPAYRNHNLGYKLKLEQRHRTLAQGIKRMTWTFDPLQSLNAHFNFSKLGVVSDQYKINFYGESTSSFLHRLGTDRLWVNWLLDSERVKKRIEFGLEKDPFIPDLEKHPRLVQMDNDRYPRKNNSREALDSPNIVIEIPSDIGELQQSNPELAVLWQEATRWAFSEAMAASYLVEEFYRFMRNGRPFGAYLLGKDAGCWMLDARKNLRFEI